MRKLLILAIVSYLFLLAGCAGTGIKPSQTFIEKISSTNGSGDTTHYFFREKAFGGSRVTVIFTCNDNVYRVQSGEFVECPATKAINFMSAARGDGVYCTKLFEDNANMPESNKTYLNKFDGNHFIFGTTSILGRKTKTGNRIDVENTIERSEAITMISEGYRLVNRPDTVSPILRYSAILNPYNDYKVGDWNGYTRQQPPQMTTSNKVLKPFGGKQGIVVFSTSNNVFSAGIWTKDKYLGSLDGYSYIFIETSNPEEALFTYFGGKLASIKVPVNSEAVAYVKFDTSLGWEVHNRKFTLSSEQEFQNEVSNLKSLILNRDIELDPSIDMIEREGLKILDTLVKQ